MLPVCARVWPLLELISSGRDAYGGDGHRRFVHTTLARSTRSNPTISSARRHTYDVGDYLTISYFIFFAFFFSVIGTCPRCCCLLIQPMYIEVPIPKNRNKEKKKEREALEYL